MTAVKCPICAGRGRFVPLGWDSSTIRCRRCDATGFVTDTSEERAQAFRVWVRGKDYGEVAAQFGRQRHEVISWICGLSEIPSEVNWL